MKCVLQTIRRAGQTYITPQSTEQHEQQTNKQQPEPQQNHPA
jgi:hypothetical protein